MGMPKLFFDNRFANGIPVATNTSPGNYAAANVADMRPYTWWKAASLPASLSVDCASAKAADFALIYGHDLFTQGATLEVRASSDNFVASNVLIATVTPTSNDPFLLEFASASYRYWRITITGATANKPAIAMAMIGAAFVMPRYMQVGFDPLTRAVKQTANNNDNGQPLGKIIQFESWKQTLQFMVTWAWLRATWQPAWRDHLRGSPFIFAWDSANYPKEFHLVSAGDGYQAPHKPGAWADLRFDVSGVAT